MTFREKATNRVGTEFALMSEPDGTWSVWRRCANYAGHAPSGVAFTWRWCARRQTESESRALYAKKLAGRSK